MGNRVADKREVEAFILLSVSNFIYRKYYIIMIYYVRTILSIVKF